MPPDEGLEVAFAGRSNAGKSSALNTLTHANLARTSKTPGRTQLLNFFALDDSRRLVDLPGYGYAKVPIPLKQHWQRHLEAYLSSRASLAGVFLMMDIRHPLTDFDRLMLDWAQASQLPIHVLMTKADKLAFGAAKNALLKVRREVQQGWATSPPCNCSPRPSARASTRRKWSWRNGWACWTRNKRRSRKPEFQAKKNPELRMGRGKFGVQVRTARAGPGICQH